MLGLISPSLADRWVREVGLGIHSSTIDDPKFRIQNPILILAVSYEFNDCLGQVCVIKYQHQSGITDDRDGFGYNLVSVSYQF